MLKKMFLIKIYFIVICLFTFNNATNNNVNCPISSTTVSGYSEIICSGDIIFSEDFNEFDLSVWEHELTLAGGGNYEFQWYTNNRSNSYTENGILYIRPTLTSEHYNENFLTSGTLNLNGGAPADQCTNPLFYGCERIGNSIDILNPIKSARIRSINSFAFKFGKVEVKAKMPIGDWLWPGIWLMPKYDSYGRWPTSGEIDLVESRGNKKLMLDGINIGVEQITSTLHFAPNPKLNAFHTSTFNIQSKSGYGWNNEFHRYQMEWTPEFIKFSIDDIESGTIPVGEGFWVRGEFDHLNLDNPWKYNSKMAPFDQEFYIILNLAVGGVDYFPDDAINQNNSTKPWDNSSPTATKDFWTDRNNWLPTWNLKSNYSKDASLQIDYVRVWAL